MTSLARRAIVAGMPLDATPRSERTIPELSGGGLFGVLGELRARPYELLARFNEECGDAGFVKLGPERLLVVNTPELVGELLVDHNASLRKSRILRAALFPLVGDGLFTSDGALWKRQRRLMSPMFHHARIAEYASAMLACASRCVATWRDGETVDVSREMTRITMAVAGKTLFDIDTFDESDALGAALEEALRWSADAASSLPLGLQVLFAGGVDALGRRLPERLRGGAERAVAGLERPILWPSAKSRRLRAAIAVIDDRVARMIAERRADAAPRNDLLSRLLSARDEAGGAAMTDRQLRDEITTLFVAGHETTATALAWALYLLGRDERARARLEEEASAAGDPLAADRLPFATKVFKETLRLYPPVPVFERQAVAPLSIGGVRLERGDYVAVFPWALHHRAPFWPEPERFDPERFAPDAERARSRHAWVPFGAGPRVCIGNTFALEEGALVLATIARRVRLEALDDRPIAPDPKAATMRALGGIRMRVRRRM